MIIIVTMMMVIVIIIMKDNDIHCDVRFDDWIPVEVSNAEHCEDKNPRKAAVLLENSFDQLSPMVKTIITMIK